MHKPIPFGKYYLLERSAVGGMAEVFKAKATGVEGFERLVAVKRILPSIAEDDEFISMFIDEAKIAVQLTHANIAQIFDLGKVDDSYFIALEYIHGKDLRTLFHRTRQQLKRVPQQLACYVTMKICEGLDYAHNKKDATGDPLNLVHRDVSPQNILLSYDGEVKLVDFGIAKAAGKASKTQAGILKGKFGYMSPEQVRGLDIDRRSDIFGVGIILYELLTSERVFLGESDFSTLEKVRNGEIVPPTAHNPEIPEQLERIVLKALAEDRDERYQSAMELHDDLQAYLYARDASFGRKELSAYMHEMFAPELEKERARDAVYESLDVNDDQVMMRELAVEEDVDTGRHELEEITEPPADTDGEIRLDDLQDMLVENQEARLEDFVVTDSSDNLGAMRPPAAPASSPPPNVKQTLLGIGSAPVPGWGEQPAASGPAVPSLVPSAHSIPAAPQASGGLQMDWDSEEEMATTIYDRPDESGQVQRNQAPAPFATPAPVQPLPAGPQGTPSAPIPLATEELQTGTRSQRSATAIAVSTAAAIVLLVTGGLWLADRKPPVGTIELTTMPKDVVVKINGERVPGASVSPFVIAGVQSGTHQIEVSKDGYRTWTTQVQVASKEPTELPHVELEPEASDTGFIIDTEPSGAALYADGNKLGETPLRVTDLTPGSHQLRIEHASYEPWETELVLEPDQVVALPKVKLIERDAEQDEASQRRRSRRAAVARATPRSRPRRAARRAAPAEEKKPVIELKKEEAAGAEEAADAEEAAKPEVAAKSSEPAASGKGTLRVNTKPWSQVFVDGKLIGTTPQMAIKLPSGTHRLTLVNAEFGVRETINVDIPPGETVTKIMQLLPE